MARPRLLILGGSRQAAAGIAHLKHLGFEIVVCDRDGEAPGLVHADHWIEASVYHLEECLEAVHAFHARYPLQGVMCLACDVPHIVARIASALGLPGMPIEVADRAVDKLAMKRKFVADGVRTPSFHEIDTLSSLIALQRTVDSELVIKPADSRGSKGVSRLSLDGGATWAFGFARDNSPTGRVIVEEYLNGPQISTESVVIEGKVVTPAFSDRSYEFLDRYYPFIVENGGDMPSNLPPETLEAVGLLVEQAAASLGVKNGIVKGDIVVHDGQPYAIELAARLSGGYFCTHQIPFSTGVNLVEACARLALGEDLRPDDWKPKFSKFVSTRWKLVNPGIVKAIPNRSVVDAMPGVLAFEHWLEVGEEISAAQNAAASVAMVQAEGPTYIEARHRAEAALAVFEPTILSANAPRQAC